ncbi:MAG: EamA family transporter [Chitinivibrionales bacterium]|nr:EamA family transporter [Chitinivibrionales bacterium]MBD3394580.1 EamA family transporter [Chitinivibrionales bacterium]
MVFKVLLLLVGVYACSTAIIMIKLSTTEPMLLAGLRQLVAALVLTPLYLRDLRRFNRRFGVSVVKDSVVPGILLGIHLISWVIGGRLTLAANASLIVNMIPAVMPVLLIAFAREIPKRREMAGTVVALSGLVILGGGDIHFSAQTFKGDIICFVSMLFFASYMALARRYREQGSLWLYVVPLYYVGGMFSLLISFVLTRPVFPDTPREILLIVGLGLIPTVFGHTILNQSMRTVRGQTVSILNLGQFVFAGVMGFFVLNEIPSLSFYAASLFVVAGSVLAILSGRGRRDKTS